MMPLFLPLALFASPADVAVAPPELAAGFECPTLIYGDHDGDGDCDDDDFVIFLQLYDQGSLKADWNFDCVITFDDVDRFLDFRHKDAEMTDFDFDGDTDLADFQLFTLTWRAEFSGALTTKWTNVTNRFFGEGDCVVNVADYQSWVLAFWNC